MVIARTEKLVPGLYLVAVPIGNARDITLRALDILSSADVLAAEDTRSMKRLLEIHGVALGGRSVVSYHDHNGAKVRPRLLAALEDGKSVAYASEAGMPLVADPGFDLARDARAAGHLVTAAPGASAVLCALAIGGQPTDAFSFLGFLPSAGGARKAALAKLNETPGTLVFYESPRRLPAMLTAAAEVLGAERPASVCRELTKKFEEVRQGTLRELAESYADNPPKGEVVVLIGPGEKVAVSETLVEQMVKDALLTMTVRDAADKVSRMVGLPRRQVYQLALKLAKGT